jgi:putative ABC transport system permease protein
MRWLRSRQHEQDFERELRSDLELEAQEQQENGLSPQEGTLCSSYNEVATR